MNLFGNNAAGDGSGNLVRNIAIAGAVVTVGALFAGNMLDNAAQNGTLNRIAGWGVEKDLNTRMANMPRPIQSSPSSSVVGIRYGNVDYTTTASIPGQKSKFKNVIANPGLGMPD